MSLTSLIPPFWPNDVSWVPERWWWLVGGPSVEAHRHLWWLLANCCDISRSWRTYLFLEHGQVKINSEDEKKG